MERGGFEPPKASPTDLQSVPFDRSGTSPKVVAEYIDNFGGCKNFLKRLLGRNWRDFQLHPRLYRYGNFHVNRIAAGVRIRVQDSAEELRRVLGNLVNRDY